MPGMWFLTPIQGSVQAMSFATSSDLFAVKNWWSNRCQQSGHRQWFDSSVGVEQRAEGHFSGSHGKWLSDPAHQNVTK